MKKNVQEFSNEELQKEAKNSKFLLGLFLGMIIVMMVCGVIITLKKGVNTFTFLPFVFLWIPMTFWTSYSKVRKELKSRNLK